MFWLKVAGKKPAELRAAVEAAIAMQAVSGSRAANQAFIDSIGVVVLPTVNEEYCAEALHYYAGMIFAHIGEAERAVEKITASGVLPGTGSLRLFSDHMAASLDLFAQREKAAARGMPTFVLASMPRAASTSLTQTLAATLTMPIVRLSVGRFPRSVLVPRWLEVYAPGGAIMHDHFGASEANLRALRQASVRDVIVLARDPRAAAVSLIEFAGTEISEPAALRQHKAMVAWIEGWLEAAESSLRLHWITYDEVRSNMAGAVNRVLDVYRPTHPALRRTVIQVVQSNFAGGGDRWRKYISNAGQETMWSALSPAVVALLGLIA